MTLLFFDTPGSSAAQERHDLGSLVLSSASLAALSGDPDPTAVAALSALTETEDEHAAATEASGDPARHALFVGRYLGQITARIERAWLRPRAPIDSGSFACRVQIVQDNTGNVREISLLQCNGNTLWQMSLVHAIQSASPLPAPPDPSVFARSLTLAFNSDLFVPGASPEGFEPETLAAMTTAGREASANQLQDLVDRLRAGKLPQPGVIDLRIIGQPRAAGELQDSQTPAPEPSSAADP